MKEKLSIISSGPTGSMERKNKEGKKNLTGQGQLQQGKEAMAGSTKNGSPSVFQLH